MEEESVIQPIAWSNGQVVYNEGDLDHVCAVVECTEIAMRSVAAHHGDTDYDVDLDDAEWRNCLGEAIDALAFAGWINFARYVPPEGESRNADLSAQPEYREGAAIFANQRPDVVGGAPEDDGGLMDGQDLRALIHLGRVRQMTGAKRREIRESTGLSIREVAAFCGVEQTTLWRWEHDQRTPTGPKSLRYARFLNEAVSA